VEVPFRDSLLVLVFFILFCLTGAEITQIPSLVVREDEKATLKCSQNDNHNSMYWYLQQPGKGMQLIYYSFDVNQRQEGDIPTGFQASRPSREEFHLDILSVKLNHSAVYFCASSLDTTLQSHSLSLHKPLSFQYLPSEGSCSQHRKRSVGQSPTHKPGGTEKLEQE
uniref:Ig-like domain-containing protein n=1 Tax=Malurus cyaneus samueli TaxID=2593467 RepID=A0A8C5X2I4_9PASS